MLSLSKHLYRFVAPAQVKRARCFAKLSMTGFFVSGYLERFGRAVAGQQQQPAAQSQHRPQRRSVLPKSAGQ